MPLSHSRLLVLHGLSHAAFQLEHRRTHWCRIPAVAPTEVAFGEATLTSLRATWPARGLQPLWPSPCPSAQHRRLLPDAFRRYFLRRAAKPSVSLKDFRQVLILFRKESYDLNKSGSKCHLYNAQVSWTNSPLKETRTGWEHVACQQHAWSKIQLQVDTLSQHHGTAPAASQMKLRRGKMGHTGARKQSFGA